MATTGYSNGSDTGLTTMLEIIRSEEPMTQQPVTMTTEHESFLTPKFREIVSVTICTASLVFMYLLLIKPKFMYIYEVNDVEQVSQVQYSWNKLILVTISAGLLAACTHWLLLTSNVF